MAEALVTFLPVAALLTVIPGPATALVVQSAFRGGSGEALRTIAGNSLGILIWALLAAVGLAAVVAASAEAFTAMKLACGIVLIYLGAQALWRSRRRGDAAAPRAPRSRRPFRAGVATSVSNPKLAVFFVALFPQFVPAGEPVLPYALAMVALQVVCDLAYYSGLAWMVVRARRVFTSGPFMPWVERLTGAVMVGLGLRVMLERRA
ncbi:MAG: LysE family translocator [Thermoleophilaceae bacterium]|nr:LysE family translocator [Thermoleophilaceae bacterium]